MHPSAAGTSLYVERVRAAAAITAAHARGVDVETVLLEPARTWYVAGEIELDAFENLAGAAVKIADGLSARGI